MSEKIGSFALSLRFFLLDFVKRTSPLNIVAIPTIPAKTKFIVSSLLRNTKKRETANPDFDFYRTQMA